MEERACLAEPMPIHSYENLNYRIEINTLNHGYVISVGCQTFAIEERERLISLLAAYLRNPGEVQRDWTENKLLPN